MMFEKTGLLVVVLMILAGCAAQGPEAVRLEKEEPAVDRVEAAPAPAVEERVDPCAAALSEAVQRARSTMKTVRAKCRDLEVEVNPMWDMNYQGRVHVRVYDAGGQLVRDEYQGP